MRLHCTLRHGYKVATANPLTIEYVKSLFDRVINLKDQPSQYVAHIDRVEIVDGARFDIILKKPEAPLLTIIAAPEFVVLERKLVEQHGDTAGQDAKTKDNATPWLNSNSA